MRSALNGIGVGIWSLGLYVRLHVIHQALDPGPMTVLWITIRALRAFNVVSPTLNSAIIEQIDSTHIDASLVHWAIIFIVELCHQLHRS